MIDRLQSKFKRLMTLSICSASLGATHSADLSTMFDVGGIIGAIAAGVLSDYTGMSACTCAGMLIFAIPLVICF